MILFDLIRSFFLNMGLNQPRLLSYAVSVVSIVLILVLASLSFFILRKILLLKLQKWLHKTKNQWDDIFLKNKVLHRLIHVVPIFVIYIFSHYLVELKHWIDRLLIVYLLVTTIFLINSILSSLVEIYQTFPISKDKPIVGYVQIIKVFIYSFFVIIIIAVLINRSPWTLLTSLGAITAILLLLFKDMIQGLVASFQITSNKLLSIDDWVCFEEYRADGNVIEIALLTVKIQNWDNTIVTVPTYAFVSQGFQNYKNMIQSGGRRIKRSFHIDMRTVRFCDSRMIFQFQSIPVIKDYISKNKNPFYWTNLAIFRFYVLHYLENHPDIQKNMTLMVRYLKPGPQGLPIEIYAFSKNTAWVPYEDIQNAILDHIIACVSFFELKIYQFYD